MSDVRNRELFESRPIAKAVAAMALPAIVGQLIVLIYNMADTFFIMRFFIDDAGTVLVGTDFLRIRCLATVFMFMSFYHVHLFNSYGRGREALFLGVMRWAVFNIPLLFLLESIFGMYGIVWTQLIADVLNVLLSLFVHCRFKKKHFA